VKDDFLATLGHELRTPLNAIIGWSQILQSGEHQPGDFAEGLATIQRNANLQAQLIEDLLDVSRIISGKLRLEMQPVDLRQVIDATIATVGPGADAKNITIEQSINDSVTTIRGDPSRLQQVIWNLLSNAVKFTPPGGTVKLSLRPADGQIEIVIEDSGVGIAPEFLPHVFERFRQEDASTRRRQGGLGLGLAIVRQLVEIHNGSVQAFSDGPGKGSRFVVRLPHFQTPATEEPSKAPDEAARRAAADLNDVRVLLVDDEADSREMLKRALESLRAKVVATCSAADAMSALKGQPFDILVSDIGMPDEDGFDLIRQVRAADGAHRSIPAIALTAFARSEDRQRALGSGYQVHVAKPVDRLALAATIQRLLHDGAGEPRQ
jgi:CheY-like chemotaxis protein/two-component sensor histidine kinase